MGIGRGFGKVILFNEHFVVYGIPAIASAIGSATTAKITASEGSGWSLDDNRNEIKGYKKGKSEQQKESVERILKAAGIDVMKNPIRITLEGDLIAASGVGASAASCAAIARALSDHFQSGFSDEKINELAYEGEKAYHGSPSGIDNTAATYGGLLWFKKAQPNIIERLKLKKPVEIVMGNTSIVANTKAAVQGVKERSEKEPEKYERIFKEAEGLAFESRKAIDNLDLKILGNNMNRNHVLLKNIGVSCRELDFLVELARSHGALGAKLTGGGLGGYMVALTPGKELQERVANAMENENFFALRTVIGI